MKHMNEINSLESIISGKTEEFFHFIVDKEKQRIREREMLFLGTISV